MTKGARKKRQIYNFEEYIKKAAKLDMFRMKLLGKRKAEMISILPGKYWRKKKEKVVEKS